MGVVNVRRWATRVALIYAEGVRSGYEGSFGFRIPPLAAAYLAAVARDCGYDVAFFDTSTRRVSTEDFAQEVSDYSPDVSAFIMNASTLAKPSIELARRLRGVSGYVVAGGHHATFTYPALLRRGFDAVFLSEGEVSFGEFLKEVREGVTGGGLGGSPTGTGTGSSRPGYRISLRTLINFPYPPSRSTIGSPTGSGFWMRRVAWLLLRHRGAVPTTASSARSRRCGELRGGLRVLGGSCRSLGGS